MLRLVTGRAISNFRAVLKPAAIGVQLTRASHDEVVETDEEFDTRYENYFNRPDIDHWEVRKGMNDLASKLFFSFNPATTARGLRSAICLCFCPLNFNIEST